MNKMINYSISNIEVCGEPDIQYRRFSKNLTKEQLLDIIKKPFITTKDIDLIFYLDKKEYIFHINSGFIFDGATIILLLVPLIGEGTDIRYMKAALIHDYFLDHKSEIYPIYFKNILTIKEYIILTTKLFKEILIQNYVSKIRASIMSFFIYLWQKSIFNKKMWRILNNV